MLRFPGQTLEISEALWPPGLPHQLRRRRLTKLIIKLVSFRRSGEVFLHNIFLKPPRAMDVRAFGSRTSAQKTLRSEPWGESFWAGTSARVSAPTSVGCGFFAYSWKLLAYSELFLLTLNNFSFFYLQPELFCLQL